MLACPDWATRRASVAISTAPAGFTLRIPILMYHRVIPPALAGASLPDLVIPPAIFAAQMAALDAAGWRTITVGQLAFDLQRGIRPPPRTFAISFDDGHADGYTYALPILVAHHFVATFFVVSGRIGEPDDLSVTQIQAMAAAGMEIADHSVNHVNLAHLGPAALNVQVQGAAEKIAAITGCWPASLAYPYGRHDPAVVRFLANAGFLLAVTEQGSPPETWANRLLAPRIRVSPSTTPADLVLRVSRFAGIVALAQGG